MRSTVPSMRSNSPPTARANARSTVVLPTPTSPSSITWPRANSATLIMRSVAACPITARATCASSARARTRQSCSSSSWLIVRASMRVGAAPSGLAESAGASLDEAALLRLELQRLVLLDLVLEHRDIADVRAAFAADRVRIGGRAHLHVVVVGQR